MNIQKYEALLKAVETGSFSRAAEELGYTQSGITHMMNALEEEVGLRLINRGYYGVRLSEIGERLLPYIKSAVEQSKKLENELGRIRAETDNKIRIGAYASIAKTWLPILIEQFRVKYPEITIVVDSRQGKTEYYQMLEEGTIDLMLGSEKPGSVGMGFLPLYKDEMYALLPPGTSSESELDLYQLNGKDFLMPWKGLDQDLELIMSENGATPNIISTHVDDPAIVSMVEHGIGVSILTELILRGMRTNVEILSIKPQCYRTLGVAWNKQYPLTTAEKRFITIIQEFTQEYKNR